jgi:hypothetical protein
MINEYSFASKTIARHLLRGTVGLSLLVAAFALIGEVGPVSLLLALPAVVALRGCPTCWALGLTQTISRGRRERSCADGSCQLITVDSAPRIASRSEVLR